MRTRGWQGDLPRDEDEARMRILAAATRCVERFGPAKTTLADVASELGVTRQTVYRYFPSVGEMLAAVGRAGAAQFLDQMADHVALIESPEQALAEAIAYTIERLPEEPHVGLLLRAGEDELFSRGVTSSVAMEFGTEVLHRFPVDWEAAGFDEHDLQELTEIMLRLFLSFIQYPSSPERSPDELRTYLRRWLGPLISRGRTLT